MKIKTIQYFFAVCFSFFLLSCEREEEPIMVLPPVDGVLGKIFQLAKVHAPDIPAEDKNYSGSIENVAINLGRIPGDTPVFIIPTVGEGPAQLKVTIGKQIRAWDLVLEYWPYYMDHKTFLEEFLKSNRDLQEKIGQIID